MQDMYLFPPASMDMFEDKSAKKYIEDVWLILISHEKAF